MSVVCLCLCLCVRVPDFKYDKNRSRWLSDERIEIDAKYVVDVSARKRMVALQKARDWREDPIQPRDVN